MTSYERILGGTALKPSEVAFFNQHCSDPLATVSAKYHAEFPHSKRSERSIEDHWKSFRRSAPPSPATQVPPAPRFKQTNTQIGIFVCDASCLATSNRTRIQKNKDPLPEHSYSLSSLPVHTICVEEV
jgi:hypothetical protein